MSTLSIADMETVAAEKVRRVPAVVQLAPSVVESLREGAKTLDQPEPIGPLDGTGLLFGRLEGSVVMVEHVLPFSMPNGDFTNESIVDLGDVVRARVHAFDHSYSLAKGDPKLSRLETLGWYSVSKDAAHRLADRDIEFRNLRFRRISDLLILLKPGSQDTILAECYSKSPYTPFSGLNHRYGSITFPRTDSPAEAAEFQMSSLAGGIDPVVLLRGPQSNFAVPALESSGPVLVRSIESNDSISKSFADSVSQRFGAARVLWVTAAGILVVAAGVTFTSDYLRSPASVNRDAAKISVAHLGMRVVPQGQNLWVTWDHKPAGQRWTSGVLFIHDAGQTHTISLDPAEISNGSLLYRPVSGRVLFELELQNDGGTRLKDSVAVAPAQKTAAQLTTPAPANPQLRERSKLQPRAHKSAVELAAVPVRKQQSSRTSGNKDPLADLASISTPESIYLRSIVLQTHPVVTSLVEETPEGAPSVPTDSPTSVNLPQMNLPETIPFTSTAAESSSPSYAPNTVLLNTLLPNAPEREISRKLRSVHPLPYVPAKVLSKIMPSAEGLGAAVLERSMVELDVHIDSTGRVAHARIVHHSGSYSDLIQQASIAAVTKWTFEPAKDYGKEVASDYTVVFHFAPPVE